MVNLAGFIMAGILVLTQLLSVKRQAAVAAVKID
jgi:hypothetical protein